MPLVSQQEYETFSSKIYRIFAHACRDHAKIMKQRFPIVYDPESGNRIEGTLLWQERLRGKWRSPIHLERMWEMDHSMGMNIDPLIERSTNEEEADFNTNLLRDRKTYERIHGPT